MQGLTFSNAGRPVLTSHWFELSLLPILSQSTMRRMGPQWLPWTTKNLSPDVVKGVDTLEISHLPTRKERPRWSLNWLSNLSTFVCSALSDLTSLIEKLFSTSILLSLSFHKTLFPFSQVMGLYLHCFSFTEQSPKTFHFPQNVSLFKSECILSLGLVSTIPAGLVYSPVLTFRVLLAKCLSQSGLTAEQPARLQCGSRHSSPRPRLLAGISPDCSVTMSFRGMFYLPLWGHWLLDHTSLRTFKTC